MGLALPVRIEAIAYESVPTIHVALDAGAGEPVTLATVRTRVIPVGEDSQLVAKGSVQFTEGAAGFLQPGQRDQ